MLRSALAVGSLLLAGAVPGHSRQPAAPDNLDGTWELVSVIEGGKLMSVDTVKQTTIKDGRVTFSGNVMQFTRPNGAARVVAFVTDPKASPRTIDLAGATAVGGKGIYQRDGDNLLICVPGADTDPRPTTFASPTGRGDVLMTFRKAAAPAVLGPPQPAPPAPAKTTDADIRAALVGTWGHQSDDRIVRLTLNSDGSFATLLTWKKGFKKLFDSEERTSGTWQVRDGVVVMTTTAAPERAQVGQVMSYRVVSVAAGEVIYVNNQTGERRIEWKLR
ncbi:TIGR03067 domain-containing protein [Urbifossiella limnaea]|uniref:TIGR03067 domain-containing protein n=1 Tax=Urbifossiella limnaea TaxID=2528023 RepID=A0A517XMN6_9BACT|nr:TIGR03067 domain-containing protein [Urbifossiella limnaea]QDU18769.1 hypothetical protein ETAA1_06650 [Urbifossiella limnaea]